MDEIKQYTGEEVKAIMMRIFPDFNSVWKEEAVEAITELLNKYGAEALAYMAQRSAESSIITANTFAEILKAEQEEKNVTGWINEVVEKVGTLNLKDAAELYRKLEKEKPLGVSWLLLIDSWGKLKESLRKVAE